MTYLPLDVVQSIDDLSWTSSVYSQYRARVKPSLSVEVFVDDTKVWNTKTIKKNLKPVWGEGIPM